MRYLLSFILLLTISFAYGQNATVQAFKAEKAFAEGQSLVQKGDYWGAIEEFKKVEDFNPKHPQVYSARAEAYYQLGRFDEAIADYTKAIELNPDDAELYNSRGVASAQQGLYRSAAQDFEKALDIDPNNPGAQQNLGIANNKLKEASAASAAAANTRQSTRSLSPVGTATSPYRSNNNNYSGNTGQPAGRTPYSANYPQNNNYSSSGYNPNPNNPARSEDNSGYPQGSYRNNQPYSNYSNRYQPNGQQPAATGSPFAPTQPSSTNQSAGTNNQRQTRDPFQWSNAPTETATAKAKANEPAKPSRYKIYRDQDLVVGGSTDPLVRINQVQLTPASTVVTFEVQGAGDQPFPIVLDRRGGDNAMYITDRSYKKKYQLRNVRLRGWPNEPYILNPGQRPVIFQVEFEPLDKEVMEFHILEGDGSKDGSWDFYDVELKG